MKQVIVRACFWTSHADDVFHAIYASVDVSCGRWLNAIVYVTCRRLDSFNNTNGAIVGKTNGMIPSVFTMIFFSVDFYGDLC